MKIRIATEKDTEDLEIIYNYFLQDMVQYDAEAMGLNVLERIKWSIQDENTCIFLCQEEEEIWGMIRIQKRHCSIDTRHINCVKITDLYVIPSKRKRGIASAFIHYVIQYAEQKGIAQIILKVDEENHLARSLYKSLGFKEQSIYQKRIVMQYG